MKNNKIINVLFTIKEIKEKFRLPLQAKKNIKNLFRFMSVYSIMSNLV